MKYWSLIFIFGVFGSCVPQPVWDVFDIFKLPIDPDSKRNVTELISSKGYPVEDHTVQTEDGYILSMQRIPGGREKNENFQKKKEVIFLQHGLLSSSTDWVLNFPSQSLAFILADAGYDVWLGNIRGNTYSRHHVKYSPNSKEFWDFSFDQMAEYDLPAMINYVLNITNESQIFYVGHSQGTTSAFAMLSSKPEFNKKIKLFVALAPVTTVGYITSPIRLLAPFTSDINFLFSLLGVNEFLPNNELMKYFSEVICETKAKFICADVIFLICGTDYSQLNETRLGVYISHTPAGASSQSIVHYAQMINTKNFQKYDYGKEENILRYNQTTPPEYNIENITTKVALFWSKNDKLADVHDVNLLQGKLKSCVSSICVKLDSFNHLDFVWGIDANTLIYNDVLALLKKHR